VVVVLGWMRCVSVAFEIVLAFFSRPPWCLFGLLAAGACLHQAGWETVTGQRLGRGWRGCNLWRATESANL
jgi:hypothetical protein